MGIKLSIIIPCWNCEKTITRLLQSIVDNNFQEPYEVITVDDCSTDNTYEKINEFKELLPIKYHKTSTEVHCPGNTRQAGLELAKGEWITFIDNDDIFEPNAFVHAFSIIKREKLDTIYISSFIKCSLDNNKPLEDFVASPGTTTWLHGKFYNKAMLNKFNVSFKKDLFSHEDLYFNTIIQNYLYVNNLGVYYDPNFFSYRWIRRPDSLSNINTGNLLYIERYFTDYLYSTTEPYFEYINQGYDDWYFKANLMTSFIMGYFYYQAGIYRIGDDYPRKNINALITLKERMQKEANITIQDLLKYAYEDPNDYDRLKHRIFGGAGKFIETTSLQDFILHI